MSDTSSFSLQAPIQIPAELKEMLAQSGGGTCGAKMYGGNCGAKLYGGRKSRKPRCKKSRKMGGKKSRKTRCKK